LGVPANLVELVRAGDGPRTAAGLQQAASSTLPVSGAVLLVGRLAAASARSVEPAGKTMPVVVFRSASQRVAVHVDEVLGNQEVVVKNLGPAAVRLPGLAGMTVLAVRSGGADLQPGGIGRRLWRAGTTTQWVERAPVRRCGIRYWCDGQPALSAPVSEVPLVLVVDDSITVRRVTQRLLQREGYRVAWPPTGCRHWSGCRTSARGCPVRH
jgi:chemosensory pili system protein ChpA (sensor histidine kinase/response regulator)